MPKLSRILVPTDYSDCSRAALDMALDLAGQFGASVDVVHVWSAPYFGPGYGFEGAAVVDPVEHQSIFDLIRARANDDMKAFVSAARVPAGVTVSTHVESGEPSRKVLELAERDHPDLIVIGTHGRTGARRWLLGSVAERVVQHAPCAVLTVPLRKA